MTVAMLTEMALGGMKKVKQVQALKPAIKPLFDAFFKKLKASHVTDSDLQSIIEKSKGDDDENDLVREVFTDEVKIIALKFALFAFDVDDERGSYANIASPAAQKRIVKIKEKLKA